MTMELGSLSLPISSIQYGDSETWNLMVLPMCRVWLLYLRQILFGDALYVCDLFYDSIDRPSLRGGLSFLVVAVVSRHCCPDYYPTSYTNELFRVRPYLSLRPIATMSPRRRLIPSNF